MEQIAIGTSGLTTSRIGLGTWAIGGWQWGGTAGWRIDAAAKVEIDAILQRCITDPVSPEFMAPPTRRPSDRGVRRHA